MFVKDTQALVVDVSAGLYKAGFAGDDAPRAVFSSAVTHTRHSGVMFVANHETTPSPHTTREMITKYPVDEYGIVRSTVSCRSCRWTTRAAHRSHTEPKTQPGAHGADRVRDVQYAHDVRQDAASGVLYASGRTIGCVINSGDAVFFTVPVYEGYAVHDAIGRLDIGAQGMTDLLVRTLDSEHHSAGGGYLLEGSTIGRKIACDIREKLTYVTLDFDEELQAASQDPSRFEKPYALPDGTIAVVGSERFRTPETLFQPWLLGKETGQGLHVCASQSIHKCATEIQQDLHSNILLSGVNTKCPGFEARVAKELVALAPSAMSIKVVVHQREMWISAAEYDEIGPSIVHRKCI